METEPKVAINLRTTDQAMGYGNPTLSTALHEEHGVDTLIIPADKDPYQKADSGLVLAQPVLDTRRMTLGKLDEYPLGVGGPELIRSRFSTPRVVEFWVPEVNGQRLRSIGASKWEQYQVASDYMPRTIAIEADMPIIGSPWDNLAGRFLVVKEDCSSRSSGVDITTREEARGRVIGTRAGLIAAEQQTGIRVNKRVLVQEYIAGEQWPGVKALNHEDDQMIAHATNTELRMYCYVDRSGKIPNSMRYFATLRVAGDGDEYDVGFVSVDQSTVPQQAWMVAEEIAGRMLERADVPGGYFSVDLIWGHPPTDQQDRIFVREINTNDPIMLPADRQHPHGVAQRQLLANLMASIVKEKREQNDATSTH